MTTQTNQTPKLNTAHLTKMFDVTPMTIYLWRKGSASRPPLPVTKPTKTQRPNAVLFDPAKVEKWASKVGVPIIVPATTVLTQASGKRRGPKPRNASA